MKSGMVKPEDISEFSDRIYNEARHLIDLIEDVIRISRLDEKNVQLPLKRLIYWNWQKKQSADYLPCTAETDKAISRR